MPSRLLPTRAGSRVVYMALAESMTDLFGSARARPTLIPSAHGYRAPHRKMPGGRFIVRDRAIWLWTARHSGHAILDSFPPQCGSNGSKKYLPPSPRCHQWPALLILVALCKLLIHHSWRGVAARGSVDAASAETTNDPIANKMEAL